MIEHVIHPETQAQYRQDRRHSVDSMIDEREERTAQIMEMNSKIEINIDIESGTA